MKIIHVVWAFQNGGIETMLINIANEQIRRGDKVSVFIINDLVDHNLVKSFNSEIKVFKIRRKEGSRSIFPIIKANFLVLCNYPKIIHFHFLNLAKYFIKYPKIKFISTVHTTNFSDRYFKKYDEIIAISKAVKEDLLKLKPDMKIEVCYNGINFNRLVKKENFYSIKKIICVGRLVDVHKGQSIIINAINILNQKTDLNFIVSFVGDGPDKLKFQELTKKLKLENNIKFLGNKSNEWVLNNLCEYDLFVQASRFEGFGLTVVEAMAAKVPVLITNVEGHLEISDNGKYATLFKSEDPKDLAIKLIKLSNELEKLEKRVETSYNYVLDKFTTEAQVQRLNGIYNL